MKKFVATFSESRNMFWKYIIVCFDQIDWQQDFKTVRNAIRESSSEYIISIFLDTQILYYEF